MEYGTMPTVAQYYKDFIDAKVDLIKEPKQCCPFHKEKTPSFSYMPQRGVWSCFGACKVRGADVIKKMCIRDRQCTMRAMIGLYVLKEAYSTAEVNVYGKRYTFELRKFAVPNKADFVTVHRTISKAIGEITGNNPVVWENLNAILVEIQQDEWKFVE